MYLVSSGRSILAWNAVLSSVTDWILKRTMTGSFAHLAKNGYMRAVFCVMTVERMKLGLG